MTSWADQADKIHPLLTSRTNDKELRRLQQEAVDAITADANQENPKFPWTTIKQRWAWAAVTGATPDECRAIVYIGATLWNATLPLCDLTKLQNKTMAESAWDCLHDHAQRVACRFLDPSSCHTRDAASAAIEKALEAISNQGTDCWRALPAWLSAIVHNEACALLKKLPREVPIGDRLEFGPSDSRADTEEIAGDKILRENLKQASIFPGCAPAGPSREDSLRAARAAVAEMIIKDSDVDPRPLSLANGFGWYLKLLDDKRRQCLDLIKDSCSRVEDMHNPIKAAANLKDRLDEIAAQIGIQELEFPAAGVPPEFTFLFDVYSTTAHPVVLGATLSNLRTPDFGRRLTTALGNKDSHDAAILDLKTLLLYLKQAAEAKLHFIAAVLHEHAEHTFRGYNWLADRFVSAYWITHAFFAQTCQKELKNALCACNCSYSQRLLDQQEWGAILSLLEQSDVITKKFRRLQRVDDSKDWVGFMNTNNTQYLNRPLRKFAIDANQACIRAWRDRAIAAGKVATYDQISDEHLHTLVKTRYKLFGFKTSPPEKEVQRKVRESYRLARDPREPEQLPRAS